MIKFFWKIRRQLLTENKFGKYLLYAIGEILLIVIGILIALQINNWNNNRIERLHEEALLTYIIEDLIYDQEILSKLIQQAISKQSKHLQLFIESTTEPIPGLNEPISMEMSEWILLLSKTWDNHQDAGDEISDKEIRSDLNNYFSDYHITKTYVETHNGVVDDLRQFNKRHGLLNLDAIFKSNPNEQNFDPNAVIHSDRMRAQFGTKEFNDLLLDLFLSTQDAIQWLETLTRRNVSLQKKLHEYLG